MKRRIFAAVLATAMVLSLAACGGGNKGGASSSNPGSGSDVSVIAPGGDSSQPDASNPDASNPDGSNPSTPDASQPEGSAPDGSADGSSSEGTQPGGSDSAVTITLNKTDVTLKKAGATFRLRYTAQPDTDGLAVFSSSDEKVATVAEDGTVTAVAPGQATITVEYDGAKATCIIRCRWDGVSSDSSDSSGSSSGSGSSSASKVDLQKFYDDTIGKYEFGFLELADSSILDNVYPGLSGISAEQMLVYVCMISMNNGEFGLVQVKDSKDVDAVKAAFQSRIDYMVGDGNGPGGAQYPMAMDQWENNSRIVSNGNYVMMVVHESCDDIVKEFNALF